MPDGRTKVSCDHQLRALKSAYLVGGKATPRSNKKRKAEATADEEEGEDLGSGSPALKKKVAKRAAKVKKEEQVKPEGSDEEAAHEEGDAKEECENELV